jgi:NADPH:quinone reductase-like Zn-dependent oxidoreductase
VARRPGRYPGPRTLEIVEREMKAVVFTRYGSPDVLELRDVATPAPADDEVLVRVHAASVNDWDWGALHGTPFVNRLMFGLFRPKRQVLGSDIAGRVEAAGKNVRQFRPGDAVFGDLSGRWGGFAEFVCAREGALVRKPPGMSFEQAAAIPQAALLALQGLRDKGHLRSGQTLLINGAGGGVGTFGIQIAKPQGVEVTAVDSADKLDMLRTLGADHVVDYTREDFTKTGQRYDLILDVKANRSAFAHAAALNPHGTYVALGGSMARLLLALLFAPWISMTQKKTITFLALKLNQGLADVNALFEAGTLVPIIDERRYSLADVPQALRYFGAGSHQGKVVIKIGGTDG